MIPAMAVATYRIDDKPGARTPELGEILRFIRHAHDRRLYPQATAYGESGMRDVAFLLNSTNAVPVDGLVMRESFHRHDRERLLRSVGCLFASAVEHIEPQLPAPA